VTALAEATVRICVRPGRDNYIRGGQIPARLSTLPLRRICRTAPTFRVVTAMYRFDTYPAWQPIVAIADLS
jgi:hypothetical protein